MTRRRTSAVWKPSPTSRAAISPPAKRASTASAGNSLIIIPDKVHLLVPRRYRGLRRPPGVVIHTHSDNENVATAWGDAMPVTAPARTLVDVADKLQPEQAAMAARQALRLGLLTRRQLEREAARQRKARVLDTLLAD